MLISMQMSTCATCFPAGLHLLNALPRGYPQLYLAFLTSLALLPTKLLHLLKRSHCTAPPMRPLSLLQLNFRSQIRWQDGVNASQSGLAWWCRGWQGGGEGGEEGAEVE